MGANSTRATVVLRHDDALGLFRGENGEVFGGMETRAFMIAGAMATSPLVDVRFITGPNDGDLTYPGVEFMPAQPPIQRGVPLLSRRVNRLRARAPYETAGPAVQLTFIAGLGSLERPLAVSAEMGVPVIGTLSCDADIDGSHIEASSRDHYFSLLNRLDAVIAQTQVQQRRLLSELGLESTLVPSLVAVDDLPPAEGSYILWVGRAAAIKRPWLFIELARRLPQYRFRMILLPYDSSLWDPLLAEADAVKNLTIIQGVPYFEMDRHYSEAALLVGTSSIEGFPNVYLQAASHAVPTASLSVPTSVYHQHDGCGLTGSGNMNQLVDLVDKIMASSSYRQDLGVRAFDYVRAVHSVESVAPILEELFSRVAR